MALAPYASMHEDVPQEVAAQAHKPVTLTGAEINSAPNLQHTISFHGKQVHYFAAQLQLVKFDEPLILFRAPVNDNFYENYDYRHLPKRMRENRGRLKIEHTPPPTITVPNQSIKPQIKEIARRKVFESLFFPLPKILPPVLDILPKPRPGFSHRANAKAMDIPPQHEPKPKPEETFFKQLVELMVLKAISRALSPLPR